MTDTTKPFHHLPYDRDVPMSEANMIVRYVNDLEADLTAAQARVAELERDAERYWWLRNHDMTKDQVVAVQTAIASDFGNAFDAAIDSARGAG